MNKLNESAAFAILMLNLLHSNAKFNLRQTKKQTDKIKQISDATREIEKNKKKEEDYTEQLIKSTFIGFIIIFVLAGILIIFNKPEFLVRLYLIAIFVYIARLSIIIFQYIYFSFQESRDLIICRLVINFCRKYDYCLQTSIAFDETIIKHNNALNDLDSEKAKERKTILFLKENFSKDILIEIKNDFCIAKEKNERLFQRLSELFPVILASIIYSFIHNFIVSEFKRFF